MIRTGCASSAPGAAAGMPPREAGNRTGACAAASLSVAPSTPRTLLSDAPGADATRPASVCDPGAGVVVGAAADAAVASAGPAGLALFIAEFVATSDSPSLRKRNRASAPAVLR